jgi:hypothetical protein
MMRALAYTFMVTTAAAQQITQQNGACLAASN